MMQRPDQCPLTLNYRSPSPLSSVVVKGSWDSWTGEVALNKASPAAPDQWSVTVFVTPGTTYFRFICDGRWISSPGYDMESNGLGETNNFVVVEQPLVDENDTSEEKPNDTSQQPPLTSVSSASTVSDDNNSTPEADSKCNLKTTTTTTTPTSAETSTNTETTIPTPTPNDGNNKNSSALTTSTCTPAKISPNATCADLNDPALNTPLVPPTPATTISRAISVTVDDSAKKPTAAPTPLKQKKKKVASSVGSESESDGKREHDSFNVLHTEHKKQSSKKEDGGNKPPPFQVSCTIC